MDGNSPDGTGKTVEEYTNNFKKIKNYTIDVIYRKTKSGLSSAIFNGVQKAKGEAIIVMDADHSHHPQTIPKMMIESLKNLVMILLLHQDTLKVNRLKIGQNLIR